jgi:hypothetical protein
MTRTILARGPGAVAGAATAVAAASLALALAFVSPAAADTPAEPPAAPEVQAWLDSSAAAPNAALTPITISPTPGSLSPADSSDPDGILSNPAAVKSAKLTGGLRITHKRGTVLLWTQNTLEWYWGATKMATSVGWQSDGFVFPNTARKGGISRTLKTSTQHNWRGTMIVGAGVVTPWGAVNVYEHSQTDYYRLYRGGAYGIN